jgi:hypothetical protein
MPWTIERKHDHVAVVTMNTNKVEPRRVCRRLFGLSHAAMACS